MPRSRIMYFFLVVITILTGLASRHFASALPQWMELYLGDALWALMVFFIMGFIFNHKTSLWIAIASLLFSFSIEISQLYHADWMDTLRSYRLAGLVLGYGFLWSDLICYSMGIVFGYFFEHNVLRKVRLTK